MSGPDSFYTPSLLADKLISLITASQVKRTIDFCVGNGNLLKAVARRYGDIELYGTDISDDAINKLKSDNPAWQLEQCDFRDIEWLERVHFLKDKKFDLIVMNPPFTCKGSIIEHIEFEGEEFKVSTAMLFLMRALRYLDEIGGVYAILPISCVYSEKDSKAWKYLKTHYNACILDKSEKVYFSKSKVTQADASVSCTPNIVMVYVGNYAVNGIKEEHYADFSSLPVYDIIRGCVRMQNPAYSHNTKAVKLIHTTNIKMGKLVNIKKVLPGTSRQVNGCGVIIPRVCNPNPMKITLLDGTSKYLLSDCVIVLRTATMAEAEQVRQHILNHWKEFVKIYRGTGAQYTTLARAKALFLSGDVNVNC
ncbi:methyltransferase [Prevotella koreensis]|uniref:Methyltransferase domain-containing protein n=1 Tax=Prevotella koreensis TaxID=2490854 RepID=A0A3S0WK81_9BACT|nr:class I SAM-dependent methyltransferase [Prevotella koreensis]RUL59253.1 methyltransferase domain-containing protein [Prevotella koreensis]